MTTPKFKVGDLVRVPLLRSNWTRFPYLEAWTIDEVIEGKLGIHYWIKQNDIDGRMNFWEEFLEEYSEEDYQNALRE